MFFHLELLQGIVGSSNEIDIFIYKTTVIGLYNFMSLTNLIVTSVAIEECMSYIDSLPVFIARFQVLYWAIPRGSTIKPP